jgi:2-polyprenyl-6-methoxyphenol hydroxylase-like FAD-dependent oxidoreductase
MHSRTLEVLRPLGVTERLLERANTAPAARLHLGSRIVDVQLGELALADTAFPHLTLVRQMDVESVLARALEDRGVVVERGVELVDASGDGDGAHATLRSRAGIESIACGFVAGCDGPESTVRRVAGIGWRGRAYREEVILADVELGADLDRTRAHVVVGTPGLLFIFALGERATWRLLATRQAGADTPPFGQPGPPVDPGALQTLLDDAGIAASITEVRWSARYVMQRRLATRFRHGRLFLAGDAAHASSPAGGQGMNTGIQDAANLGWKLAFATRATDPAALLDSYEQERRPVARQVLRLTHAGFWAEAGRGPLPTLLRGVVVALGAPALPAPLGQRWLAAEVIRWVSQLRTAYPGSPLSVEGQPRLSTGPRAGARLPDATVRADGIDVRLHALVATPGVHVLLHRDAILPPHPDVGAHVTLHRITSTPGTGVMAVRPDGYIGFRCQVADLDQLSRWLARIGALPTSSVAARQ